MVLVITYLLKYFSTHSISHFPGWFPSSFMTWSIYLNLLSRSTVFSYPSSILPTKDLSMQFHVCVFRSGWFLTDFKFLIYISMTFHLFQCYVYLRTLLTSIISSKTTNEFLAIFTTKNFKMQRNSWSFPAVIILKTKNLWSQKITQDQLCSK